jgi:fucose permease
MHKDAGVSLEAVGLLLGAGTVGHFLFSFNTGRIFRWLGTGLTLLIAAIMRTIGVGMLGLAASWPLMLTAGLLIGAGAGGMDAGLNIHFSQRYSAGQLTWVHAFYGVGATISPVLIAWFIDSGFGWQLGYLIAAAAHAVMAVIFLLTVSRWNTKLEVTEQTSPDKSVRETLRLPLVWVGIALFLVYTGAEVSVGQWSYPLLTEARGVSITTAGTWVSIYWGTFTIGRFLSGLIGDRIRISYQIRAGVIAATVGAALIWWNPVNAVGFTGIALMGFAFAPVFPLMLSFTARRLESGYVDHAIGFEVGAAGIGVAILPALAGIFADRIGLETIGPFLLGAALLLWVLYEVFERATRAET